MTFEVSTLYEMGQRAGFEPVADEIADQLLDELLPWLPLGTVDPVDEPYLQRILMTAAQLGAGIGLVEVRTSAPADGLVDRQTWGVLWKALGDLPTVPAPQRFAAAFLMQAGHYVARVGDRAIPGIVAGLRAELDSSHD
ncbi:MAG: hypothetical protein ABJA16_02010 [Nakamurella sp.]